MKVTRIGIDLAKQVFQAHGVDEQLSRRAEQRSAFRHMSPVQRITLRSSTLPLSKAALQRFHIGTVKSAPLHYRLSTRRYPVGRNSAAPSAT